MTTKRLILALVCLACAATVGMGNRVVNRTGGGGGSPALIASGQAASANANDVAVTINATGANFVVVNVAYYDATSVSVSDGVNGAYTGLTAYGPTEPKSRIFYHQGGTYGAGLVITATGTGTYMSMQVLSFSNMASSPLDQQNGASVSGVDTIATGSITPSQANSVSIVALANSSTNGGTITVDSGYTITEQTAFNTGVSEGGVITYKILTSATAQNVTWSSATGGGFFNGAGASIANFKY